MIYLIAALVLILVLGHEQSRFILFVLLGWCLQVLIWVIGAAVLFGLAAWVLGS